MKVTRTLLADSPPGLKPICKVMGFLRADIWRRYGGLGTVGKSATQIRTEITERGFYAGLSVDGTIRAETTKDVVNDIMTYKAAAKEKVRRAIAKRTEDPEERNRLYSALKSDTWLQDNFLHRQMRKHFKHGRSRVANQFVVRSDKHSSEIIDGRLTITVRVARKFGSDIVLTTTSNGKNVDLTGSNLRIVAKDGFTEIHYVADKDPGRPHGEQALGIDKGYTEAFTDSDGDDHGIGFGKVLTEYSDATAKTGKNRNKLHALEKKHRAAGKHTKADRIRANNLGRKKVDARREHAKRELRGIAFKAAHSLVDKAALVASEDLTSPIAKKQQWKRYNRRMSMWAKGALADALDSVCHQRNADHHLVNAAYTSQVDPTTKGLTGRREGDRFYCANGDVLQADYVGAMNVLDRLSDREITRYMPYKEVRQILLARSPAELTVTGHELGQGCRQPCADKSNA